MAVINLRGFPDELARTLKATAASEGESLRDFIVGILQRDVGRGGYTAPAAAEVSAPMRKASVSRSTVRRIAVQKGAPTLEFARSDSDPVVDLPARAVAAVATKASVPPKVCPRCKGEAYFRVWQDDHWCPKCGRRVE